jgi:thiamine-phosphate pyrophosphorylase
MRLILITPPTTAATELATVNQLFCAGLPVLHVRKPDADAASLRAYLQQIEPAYRQRLVLHQHHELATDLGLKVCGGTPGAQEHATAQPALTRTDSPWRGRVHHTRAFTTRSGTGRRRRCRRPHSRG